MEFFYFLYFKFIIHKFLLNLIDADFLQKIQKFTIQNVSIKLKLEAIGITVVLHLQYKMFLLNLIFLKLPI